MRIIIDIPEQAFLFGTPRDAHHQGRTAFFYVKAVAGQILEGWEYGQAVVGPDEPVATWEIEGQQPRAKGPVIEPLPPEAKPVKRWTEWY